MKALYRAFVEGDADWQPVMSDGQIAGTLGESRPITGVILSLEGAPAGLGVCYRGHFANVGWTVEVANGQSLDSFAGGNQLEAIQIGLFGPDAGQYDIVYRAHVQDYGWLNWARDGETSGTEGLGKRLEALQVYCAPKGQLFFDVGRLDKSLKAEPRPVTQAPQQPAESADSKRRRVVDQALSYVGYTAGAGNYSVFGERQGDPHAEWCSAFVRSVFEDAGLAALYPKTTYVPDAVDWFRNHEQAYFHRRGAYTPKPGDVIFFDYNRNGTPDHVGLVEGTDGRVVSTVEGNTGNPRKVRRKTAYYGIGSADIFGYGVPVY